MGAESSAAAKLARAEQAETIIFGEVRTAVLSSFRVNQEEFQRWCLRLKIVLFEKWPGVAALIAGGGTTIFLKAIFDECARRRNLSSETIEEEIGRWARIEYPMADLDALRAEPLLDEIVDDIEAELP
jgi:hypothetical protein